MGLSAFDRLAAERIAIMRLADGIQQALGRPATTKDLQQVAFDVIDGHDRRVRPYLKLEERFLQGTWGAETAAWEAGTQRILATLHLLRRGVESGQPLRPVLEAAELELRGFLEVREQLVRDLRRRLPAATVAGIGARFDEYESQLVRPRSLATLSRWP